jgi:hypothetical protein
VKGARRLADLRESRRTPPAIPGDFYFCRGRIQKPGAPVEAGRISGAFTPKRRCAK